MTFFIKTSVAVSALIASAGLASADCGIESGSVRILSNDFTAARVVADWAEKCASDTVQVTRNQTQEHKNIQVPALSTNPAKYTVAMVASNSVVPLLNDDLIRPLDDLIAKYGQQLTDSQKIVVDGKIMAIAFMANSQQLFYRDDILSENGIEPPTNYAEFFAAASKLQEAGVLAHPVSSNLKPGWNVAAEFINTYLGTGKDFFEPGSAKLAMDQDAAIEALENMKTMTDYMSADWATYDSNAQKPVWEAGEVALSIGWGSIAGSYIAEDSPSPDIAAHTSFAAAPSLGDHGIPAVALWWDGFTIAKNISDEDAEASFRAMMNGISGDMLAENQDAAVWLIDGYTPTKASSGVLENLKAGARPYPMLPYMGLLHTALGDNLNEFLQGKESAQQALVDVNAAYTAAATEAGFLN
ncbi:ABC transporter substrate-binding protein [Salipiger mangrovisoli]|uniref:Extracellular solute-binding protein n=1 Tax=Salipiger mangrovisoli TaxID=2865933 RepID=A0ABR9X5H5_9RHOB|nr:extracellular solute-binding protein [Salipiger mangrovisoli]MBE9638824.1 extracellular solute-binding protein [Salipiger mangrovisoli]